MIKKLYKIYKMTSYGSCSQQDWRNLTLEQANSLKSQLETLNPKDKFEIEAMS